MVITCIIYCFYCIFAVQTIKNIVMDKFKFHLISAYFDVKTYEKLHCTDFGFRGLSGLLTFYRYLLNDGYVYEFQFGRFVKVNGPLMNIIYMV